MNLKKSKFESDQTQNKLNYEQHSLNQLKNSQNINEKTENKQFKNNKKQKLNNKWNKIASKLKSNWLLKFEFLFILIVLGISIYFLDFFGVKIYQVISKGTTGENNVHLELAIIINKNHEQYVYANSLKDPFFLLKSGIFNVLSMITDVFYATLKTAINETSIFVGNLSQLTRLLRMYQILIAVIFIIVPFLLFFIHILKTLFRKIALISNILVTNNIGQLSNNEANNKKQVKSLEKPVKKKKIKKIKNTVLKTLSQNLNLTDRHEEFKPDTKQLLDKMDLKNNKNNDTINNEKKKEYNIGDTIFINNVAHDIIKFQDQKQNGKLIKIVLAWNTKTVVIINFPYNQ